MRYVLIALVAMVVLTACTTAPSNETECAEAGGQWLSQYNECEGITEEQCNQMDGEFDNCASACRHDPDADVCTKQCVLVCKVAE
ncbi:MAG: hypothetical protein ACQEP1_01535 [Nanobdellota archaeon]